FALACNGVSNSSGEGGGSQGAAPSAPAGLTATAGDTQVGLSWNASTGAASYNVKRSTSHGGPYAQIGTPSAANYIDTGLTDGTTYYYVVSAVNSSGQSANSNEVSATPVSAATVPSAPTGLTATAGDQQVILNWNASSGATGYHVKRGTTSGGPYTQVAAPGGTSDTDTGLSDGTTYYYVVSAVNSAGESATSSQVSATPVSSSASVHVTVDVL